MWVAFLKLKALAYMSSNLARQSHVYLTKSVRSSKIITSEICRVFRGSFFWGMTVNRVVIKFLKIDKSGDYNYDIPGEFFSKRNKRSGPFITDSRIVVVVVAAVVVVVTVIFVFSFIVGKDTHDIIGKTRMN